MIVKSMMKKVSVLSAQTVREERKIKMAAKGTLAKQNLIQKFQTLLGDDYIGESGGKHYVWAQDGAERVQIPISLTCPKNPIGAVDMGSAFSDGLDFEAPPVLAQTKFEPAEITEQEVENLSAMMARLGL
jgi:hypothetical protein